MTYHSPRPGEAAPAPSRPPAAEPPAAPSSASSSASASSPSTPSASPAGAGGAPSSSAGSRVSPPPGNLQSGGGASHGASHGTPSSAPSGTPLPPARKRGGVSPFLLALAAGAGIGAYAWTSGAPRGDDESRESPPMTPEGNPVKRGGGTNARVDEKTPRKRTGDEPNGADENGASLAPAARAAARLLLKRTEPADAEASVERSEKTLNSKDSKDSKDSKEEDASDVFGSAADAILAAADAAADAARRADEKDGAARRRGRTDAGPRAAASLQKTDDLDLEGPALAARGKAFEAVAAKALANDSTVVSGLVRARATRAEEEAAELTPAALVAKSFQDAAEVRIPPLVFLVSASKLRCYTQLPGPSRAESVFSRSQTNDRAAALVAQFLAPSRTAGRVMESGSLLPASPKTPDDIRHHVDWFFLSEKIP